MAGNGDLQRIVIRGHHRRRGRRAWGRVTHVEGASQREAVQVDMGSGKLSLLDTRSCLVFEMTEGQHPVPEEEPEVGKCGAMAKS